MVLIVLLIIASLILYVAAKVSIVRLGYRIEALEREKKELERANRSLRIEASSLSSPARIEEIATKRMGMVRPPKENVVTVKRRSGARGDSAESGWNDGEGYLLVLLVLGLGYSLCRAAARVLCRSISGPSFTAGPNGSRSAAEARTEAGHHL